MTESITVRCPKCSEEFPLSEAVLGSVRDGLEKELGADVERREKALAEKSKVLAERKQALEKQAAEQQEQVEAQVKQQLARATGEIKAKAVQQATEAQEMTMKELRAELVEKAGALKNLQAQELELRREKRQLEEAREALKLEVQRTLDEERGKLKVQLRAALDLDTYFVDTTCVKANIHFPVDWILFRDATRTLMKAVVLIRQQGLKHRMEEPQLFMSRMNRLCIEMSQARTQPDNQRRRKRIFRKIDKLSEVVREHARRYRELLAEQWEKTEWTRPQTDQVLRRMDNVLTQLPQARRQARQHSARHC